MIFSFFFDFSVFFSFSFSILFYFIFILGVSSRPPTAVGSFKPDPKLSLNRLQFFVVGFGCHRHTIFFYFFTHKWSHVKKTPSMSLYIKNAPSLASMFRWLYGSVEWSVFVYGLGVCDGFEPLKAQQCFLFGKIGRCTHGESWFSRTRKPPALVSLVF